MPLSETTTTILLIALLVGALTATVWAWRTIDQDGPVRNTFIRPERRQRR